ncbi:MAG: hypothetical protein ACI4S3_10340 [Candidatus Gastranaerophilaceae bacterium]
MNIAMSTNYTPTYRAKVPTKKMSSIDLAYEKELAEIKRAKADRIICEKLDPAASMEKVKSKLQIILNGLNIK